MSDLQNKQACCNCKKENQSNEIGCMSYKDMASGKIVNFIYCQKEEPTNDCRREAKRRFETEYSMMMCNYNSGLEHDS